MSILSLLHKKLLLKLENIHKKGIADDNSLSLFTSIQNLYTPPPLHRFHIRYSAAVVLHAQYENFIVAFILICYTL